MQKKLGLLAGLATLASLVIPLTATAASASPVPLSGTSVTQKGGVWYCFGQKATKTAPDGYGLAPYYNPAVNDQEDMWMNIYHGTPGKDVIVTTNQNDYVDDVSPGDVVCTREGDDVVRYYAYRWGSTYNRIKVDLGLGDDAVDESGDDFGGTPPEMAIIEAHGGPGRDFLVGSENNDLLFGDDGSNVVYCGHGDDQMFGNASMPSADCERFPTYSGYPTASFAKFKPSTGSWSMVCPGEPSKSATWYVNATGYGATNPCARWLDLSWNWDSNGPTDAIVYHVKPGTKLIRKGFTLAQDGIIRTISFPAHEETCSSFGKDYITKADGSVKSMPLCP